ncbi:hypothetical protein NQ314_011851 [Rhamnusium bicolor]|uniref:peptidyl-tRNA hydrolase n=1 Tax=Rhamnusium bicolor TaxID=1586634 RepID=A0AAV8XEU1_9CUCU|nr:hypothetical protein NQ314_011851 [Rhamnusium bicolor]
MGIPPNIATEALFCTGNKSLDHAVNYVFNSQEYEQETNDITVKREPDGPGGMVDNSGDETVGEEVNYKMTFVVNTSLKMGVGKIAAQVAHACLGLYREMLEQNKEEDLSSWEYTGEKKLC